MKKMLIVLTPLFVAGCSAAKDTVKVVEDQVTNPPTAFLEFLKTALTTLLNFVEGLFGAAVTTFIHGLFPF